MHIETPYIRGCNVIAMQLILHLSQKLMNMLNEEAQEVKVELTRQRNYWHIRELMRISLGLGVNFHKPTPAKERLRILNVMLVVFSIISLWNHWLMLVKFIDQVDKIAETVCSALQTTIAIVKMIYCLFRQRRIAALLQKALRHDVIREIEIFDKDFPEMDNLRKEIDDIMSAIWRRVRYELLFYIWCCGAILTNYTSTAVFTNLYHQLKGTPNYVHILPFTGYPIWADKGMMNFYYPFEMFMGACALYIAGMSAVSFDGLFTILSMHGVGLTRVLNKLFIHSTSPTIPPERRAEFLRYCIRQYQRTFDYLDELNDIYMHVSLSQFVQSLVDFGFVLYEMDVGLKTDKIIALRMVMYLSAAGQQLIIYGINGQRVTTATDEISNALYSCEWYNQSPEFKKLLLMMMIRANRTYYCKISWFSTMSLAVLMSIFKASGSYFLLLRDLSD